MRLTVENVTYRYRNSNSYAVKGVNCAFDRGKLYAIMGPSGSGKSTILSMVAGLDIPADGSIRFGDGLLSEMDLDRYRRDDVSIIFQAFQLFPLLTAVENVCYPMEISGVSPKEAIPKAQEYLLRVGITGEKFKRFPSNMSGGEQQRVAIARSLASGAKVILADEPTGNLDIANTEIIMGLLQSLAYEDGYCVIVVTHDIDVANKADVVYRMSDGTMAEIGNEALA